MKNLAIKNIETQKRELKLVELMDSEELKKDKNWFRGILKTIFVSQDLDMETFERLETKKTVHSIMHDFN